MQQWQRHEIFEHTMQQHDLASLVAFSFSEPGKLQKFREEYLNNFLPASFHDERIKKAQEMIEAHRRMVPTEPH